MKKWFFVVLIGAWLLITFSSTLFQTEKELKTSNQAKNTLTLSRPKKKSFKQISLKDKLYPDNYPKIALKNVNINIKLNPPENIDIINIGTSQQRLTLVWDKIQQDNLSDDSIQYKIYRKVGVGEKEYTLISVQKNLAYNHNIQQYSYSDAIENTAHTASEWRPLRYYSYVITSMSTFDNTESIPSPAVYGYLVPDIPVDALKDIWKTLEFAHVGHNGFADRGSSSEYQVGKISGYFKKTRRFVNYDSQSNIPYIYEYNQFAAYHTISIDGVLNALMNQQTKGNTILINGQLTITGIYSAILKFVDFIISAENGKAQSGFLVIEYYNQKQEIPFNTDILDTLIINNPG